MRADGSGLRVIRGTNGANGPVFSPDGRTVAFTRSVDRETPTTVGGKRREEGFHGASIWTVDLLTGAQRQLTPWRDGLEYSASSFSPDGSTLLATHEDNRLLNESEPVALELDGSGSRRLLDDGSSPVYSPDGSKIALVRRIDGIWRGPGRRHRSLRHPRRRQRRSPPHPHSRPLRALPQLGSVRRAPGLRPAPGRQGRRTRPSGSATPLMQINADGTCQTKVVSARRTFFFAPTWQPGPGREAGTDRVLSKMIGMRRMIRSALGAGLLALLLLTAGVAGAAAPAGPRLAVVKETWNPRRVTLLTVDPDGGAPMRLAGGQENDSPVEASGGSHGGPTAPRSPFPASGRSSWRGPTGAGRELNIAGAERPVFAPDGHTLAFTRYGERGGAAIWTIDLVSWRAASADAIAARTPIRQLLVLARRDHVARDPHRRPPQRRARN